MRHFCPAFRYEVNILAYETAQDLVLSALFIRHIGFSGRMLVVPVRPGIRISPTNVGNATVLADGTPAKPSRRRDDAAAHRFLFLGGTRKVLRSSETSRWVRSPFVDDDPVIDTTGDPLAGLRDVDGHPHGQVRGRPRRPNPP